MLARLAFACSCLLLSLSAIAAPPDFFFPDADYDPDQPTIEEVLGHEMGSRLTRPAEAIAYLNALQEANPERMRLVRYATSWEGRPLVYAIIAGPDTIARLDAIQDQIQTLADPRRTPPDEAEPLIADLPATVWLSYAVHGNEISTTDAALLAAYHLLASRGDARVDAILDKTIVFIDPLQNPDGRARFIAGFEQGLGLEPLADRQALEHDEAWPYGRTNHYLFDLNRDWYILSQPESQGKVAAVLKWLPLILVDAHEMGGDSTYYFAPSAKPYNIHQPPELRAAKTKIGQNTARWFDRFGIDYFAREVFDSFYPGYGDTWPSYYGSLSQTYEQASARGLVFRQEDGDLLTYADGVRNHFLASMSAAEVAADNRADLWRAFYAFRQSAVEEGRSEGLRSYVLPVQANQAGADDLARLLARQGVEVARATQGFSACGTAYEAGSYVIDLAQPMKRLVRVLMDTDMPIDEAFLAEQERRRAKGLPVEMYDISAWSLPLTFNVQADRCERAIDTESRPVRPQDGPKAAVTNADAQVAFLVPWGEHDAAELLAHALRAGLTVTSTDLAFTHQGVGYPRGTLIFKVQDNPDDLARQLADFSARTGAEVIGVDSSWVTEGPNFGSGNVVTLRPPKIALAWDEPTGIYSPGNLRFVIERRLGYPVTPMRTRTLAQADLSAYDVVIVPDGSGYAGIDGLAETLTDFAEEGGVLLGIAGGAAFLADKEVDLITSRLEQAWRPEDSALQEPPEDETDRVPGVRLDTAEAYEQQILPQAVPPDRLPGAILTAETDPDHWSTVGLPPRIHSLIRGEDVFTPLKRDEGVNAVRFAGPADLVASGLVWEENRAQLAFKPLMMVVPKGRGIVTAITADIATRAYQPGLDVMLANILFRGPAHSRGGGRY